jgi:hypothetical protein
MEGLATKWRDSAEAINGAFAGRLWIALSVA